jgi:hypothetical protein
MTFELLAQRAVNAPQSRRFARVGEARQSRQRLDCGDFSTAFERETMGESYFDPACPSH